MEHRRAAALTPPLTQPAEAGSGHCVEDRVAVDPIKAIQIRDISRLTEMLDAERLDPVSAH